jgi:hypothetical protein
MYEMKNNDIKARRSKHLPLLPFMPVASAMACQIADALNEFGADTAGGGRFLSDSKTVIWGLHRAKIDLGQDGAKTSDWIMS